MKVLHVNTHLNIGGIGWYIVSLTRALKARGIESIVASSGGEMEGELKKNGIAHRPLNLKTKFEFSPKVFRAASSLARVIDEEKIDIIHAHTRVSQVASHLASGRAGVPYVSTCHGYFKARLSRKLFDSWGIKVVAISDAVRDHLKKDFGIDENRIEVIFNGIDMERFSKIYSRDEISKAKTSLGLKEGPVVGTMGRLSPVKGQRFLIEAMKNIISKRRSAQCLIIGSGPEEEALKGLANSLGIAGSVHFAGSRVEDTPLYLSCMDVFVLPSVKEGLGLALLEAMSAGRPCVASETGGISDIIKNGANGLLVPVGDAEAIEKAILKILDDRALSDMISRNSRELDRSKYSLDLMAERMTRLYERVLSEKH